MAAIDRFEGIEAWNAARELAKRVYHVSKDGSFYKDISGDQLENLYDPTCRVKNLTNGFIRYLGSRSA